MWATILNYSVIFVISVSFTDGARLSVVPNGNKVIHKNGVTHEISRYLLRPENPNVIHENDNYQSQINGPSIKNIDDSNVGDIDNSNVGNIVQESINSRNHKIENFHYNGYNPNKKSKVHYSKIHSYGINGGDMPITENNKISVLPAPKKTESYQLFYETNPSPAVSDSASSDNIYGEKITNQGDLLSYGNLKPTNGPSQTITHHSLHQYGNGGVGNTNKYQMLSRASSNNVNKNIVGNVINNGNIDTEIDSMNDNIGNKIDNNPFENVNFENSGLMGLSENYEDINLPKYDKKLFRDFALDQGNLRTSSEKDNDEDKTEQRKTNLEQDDNTEKDLRSLNLAPGLLQLDDSRLESSDSNQNLVSEASNIYEIDENLENYNVPGSRDYYSKLSNADYDLYTNMETETGKTNGNDKSTKQRLSYDYINLDNTPYDGNDNQYYYSSDSPHGGIAQYYGGDRSSNVEKTAYIVPANVNGKIINAGHDFTNTDYSGDFEIHSSDTIVNNVNINSKSDTPVISPLQSILNWYPNHFSNNCDLQHYPHSRRIGFLIINGQRYAVDKNILNYIISQKCFNTLNEQDAYRFIIINGEKYALDANIFKYIISQKQPIAPNKQYVPGFVIINGEKYAIDRNILQYVLSHKHSNVSKKRHAHIVVIINGDKYALDNNIVQYILTHKKSNVPNNQYPHSFVIINGEKYALDDNILQYIISHKQSNTLNEHYADSLVKINGVKYALDINILKYILSHKQSNANNRDVNKVESYVIENQYINDGSVNDLNGQNQVFNSKVVKYLFPKQRQTWRPRHDNINIDDLDVQPNESDVKIVFPQKIINPKKYDTEILDLDIDNSNNAQIDNTNQIIVLPGSNYNVKIDMAQKLAIERKHNLAKLKEFLLSIVLHKASSIEKMNLLYNNVLSYIVVLDSRDVPKSVIAQLIRKIQNQVLYRVKKILQRQKLNNYLNRGDLCAWCQQLNA